VVRGARESPDARWRARLLERRPPRLVGRPRLERYGAAPRLRDTLTDAAGACGDALGATAVESDRRKEKATADPRASLGSDAFLS
jgi:hypothetical protein